MEIASNSASVGTRARTVQSAENAKDSEKQKTNETSAVESGSDEFSAFMRKALGGDAKTEVNEEELFAALIEQRLEKISPEAAESFRTHKATLSSSMAKADGYIPMEDMAKAALKAVVEEGVIDRAQADQINGESFAAAQLDGNKEALFDGRGGPDDPTVAKAAMETALLGAKDIFAKLESGELTLASRSLDLPSNVKGGASGSAGGLVADITPGNSDMTGEQTAADGADGFLWKPVSESDGNLVVLLPSELNGLIDKVEVHSGMPFSDETKEAEGRYANIGNGNRQHYRFDRAGAEFGEEAYVVAHRANGETIFWKIDSPAERID